MHRLTLQDLPQQSIISYITAIITMPGTEPHKVSATKNRMDRLLIRGAGGKKKNKKSYLPLLPVISGLCSELGKKLSTSAEWY